MKGIFIKWHKEEYSSWAKKERKVAIKAAHHTIRQKTRQQLRKFCTDEACYDDFIHPMVGLPWFD